MRGKKRAGERNTRERKEFMRNNDRVGREYDKEIL